MSMKLYESSIVHYAGIPIGGPTDEFWRTTHQVVIPSVCKGDVLQCHSCHQYKNNNSYWVELLTCLCIDDYALTGAEELHYKQCSAIMGANFHHGYGHYAIRHHDLFYQADKDYPALVCAMRVRARKDEAGGEVNCNYPNTPPQGHIQVVHHKGA